MKQLISIYQESIKENLKDIKAVLERLNMLNPELEKIYEQVLSMTSQNITGKWEAGRKYARTYFSRKAFSIF
jgi:DNA integrity scanning protein DisA with diadenylate cyclase activity